MDIKRQSIEVMVINGIDDLWILEADEEYGFHDNKHDKGYKYLLSVKKVFVELL